jgi:hypothetical protein
MRLRTASQTNWDWTNADRANSGGVHCVLALAACGGGNDGDQLTAEEFREQADAICAEYEGRLDELETPQSLDDVQQYVDDAVPILEEGTAELGGLQPPDELEEDWNRAMEVNREQLENVQALQQAVEDGDQAEIAELLQQADEARQESDELATQLGLEECGSTSDR